jgi:transcriptional regulator with GAF, ATPase, and Fis domain
MSAPAPQAARALVEALRGVLCQLAEPTAVLRAILEQAVALTGAARGLFVEVREGGELEYRVLHGFAPGLLEGDAGAYSRRLFARVIEGRQAVVLANALEDVQYRDAESVRAMRVAAILCLPIVVSGRVAALVHLEHPEPGHFGDGKLDTLLPLADLSAPVLEALRAGRELAEERDRLRDAAARYRDEAEDARGRLASEGSFERFVGRAPAVRELEVAVRRAAASDFPVLIHGETGTGKGLVARALHYASPRATGALVTVFCPSLERGMVEAELFGHRRGAFTGAHTDRAGKVQAAEGGTLFLDEVGELPMEIQAKLLRLLQERTYERLGDTVERRADVRVVAATHRDLELEVEQGRFRRDLLERLNFLPLRTPPLRERPEDIPLLLRHCLDATPSGRWVEVSREAEAFLISLPFAWPGNVRHVEQLAARLVVEGSREPATPADLERLLGARERGADRAPGAIEQGLPRLLEDAERSWLEEALRRYPALTRAELADRLKISESSLYKKLRQYGLQA